MEFIDENGVLGKIDVRIWHNSSGRTPPQKNLLFIYKMINTQKLLTMSKLLNMIQNDISNMIYPYIHGESNLTLLAENQLTKNYLG